ncbi:TonB-dependent receptor [bacterium BD-1]|uniref:TonB-dependent receptor plug domain-containing protein n=1 Tax=Arenimonas sp. TaxID=1872635 RepID=UPI001E5F2A06|nr:TonB-dependent receptor [Ottowia caeni]
MQSRTLSASIQRALLAMAAVSAGALSATSALAQESEDAATLDTIEVTGSRLKRADIEGAVPVIVIDRAQIDASGDVSVADVLRDSTFASFGNFKPQSGSSAQSLATIDLRGVGSGRTLVLIDGRRAPTNPMSASSGTDLNAIPLAAVERIEILSDGASAVYGSDAIGGVVNVILRKDFNGAELRYGIGSTEVKGGDLQDMSVVFGSSSDRTRVIGGASSSKRGMVFTRDQIGGSGRGVSDYGNNFYDWTVVDANEDGVIDTGDLGDVDGDGNAYDGLTGDLGAVPGFACNQGAFYFLANGLCSFNFNSVAANDAKVGTKSVFIRADHQINDNWSIYGSASMTKVETFGRYAPVPGVVRVEDGTSQDINNNPLLIAAHDGVTDGLPTYYFHRFAAAGNRDNFTDTTNADYLVGFQGQLTDTIGIDFGARRTDYKYTELGRGYIVASLANAAANNGDYDLTDPYSADPAVLSGMQATISRDSRWTTDEIYALLNFDLFEMGGGTSNGVFGVEYREDNLVDLYDSLSEAGEVLGSSGNSTSGSRDAKAVYFEWLLPFTSNFDITLAGRWDSYSDYGNDFSPKIAMRWQPLDTLTLRGSFGQGFRAPGLDILNAKTAFSAEPVNDAASCAAVGEPSTCQLQVNTYFQANPNLSSEQSTQFSVGAVWDPLEWLDLSVDYYNIEIEDSISQITPQAIINSELDPVTYGPIPPGMSITRRADGSIKEIVAGYANQGTLETDGIDFRANTSFDLGKYGELRNQLTISYINSYDVDDGLGNITEFLDINGYPDRRGSLYNTWTFGDFTAGWNINYIGANGPVGGYATNDVQLTWNAPWKGTITVGATNVGDRYPELTAFDGRPWNFYLYDAYGRTTYFRYTQTF